MNFSTLVQELPRIGPQYQKKLKKLGIKTVRDLLFHFPHRYEDFSEIIPISNIRLKEQICIQGKILEIENNRTWKRRMILTQALIQDQSGAIKVIWFNQPYLVNALKSGDFVCLAGKLALRKGETYLSNPIHEKIPNPKFQIPNPSLTHTGRLIPVYPETEGLSSKWLRFIIKPLLVGFKNKNLDSLPRKIIKDKKLMPLEKALWQIHFPDSIKLATAAKKRFSFEELFLIQLLILRERMKFAKEKSIAIPLNLKIIQSFIRKLPFKLTDSQKKSIWQILKDMEKPKPMNRLLEGDVGSGKTIVAAIAALNIAKAGYQTVFMAPTEILSKQHFQNLSQLFKNSHISVGLLTGKEKIKNEESDILIGTQALIQDKVKFKKLALVILDEQHRFGVEQRAKLCRQKDFIPHLLSMTATPIPRTLTLTIYGDLDLSSITELPKGRKKIITKFIAPNKRQEAYDFIRKQVKQGRQVFVICPRIEPSEVKENNLSWAEVKAVKEEYEKLSKDIFSDLKVGELHGKMKTEEKEKVIKNFKERKINILVSTSVIEVGIDIPNASLIMIEGAERFGLSQLHQFRGRVGRSEYQSFCFLFTESSAKKTGQRLRALLSSNNGFALAEKDLEIRGPGDFSGIRQWGIPDLSMASLKDIFLVQSSRNTAKEILEEDPELKKYPLLRERLEKFQQNIHLE